MGLEANGCLDVPALRTRIAGMEETLREGVTSLLESQGVRLLRGTGRLVGAYAVEATTDDGVEQIEADAILLSTGSRPRVPEWATIDGERILTTRQAYPPPEIPEHLVVIGSGVTGVEFTHMFSALGAQVSLIVSRQQVLPTKDPEVAAVLENEFIRRGVKLLKGARAIVDRPRGRQGVHRLRRRPRGRRFARAVRDRLDAEHRRARLRGRGRR